MQIRKAKIEDLTRIMPLYEKAREFMAKNGNPTQWGKNNPPEDLIRKDIEEGYLYVGEVDYAGYSGGFLLRRGRGGD